MSRTDPKFSIGDVVMVVTQADGIRASNTIVESVAWVHPCSVGDHPSDPAQRKVPAPVGWHYQVSAFRDGRSFYETALRPRPEPGDSWNSIKQSFTTPESVA